MCGPPPPPRWSAVAVGPRGRQEAPWRGCVTVQDQAHVDHVVSGESDLHFPRRPAASGGVRDRPAHRQASLNFVELAFQLQLSIGTSGRSGGTWSAGDRARRVRLKKPVRPWGRTGFFIAGAMMVRIMRLCRGNHSSTQMRRNAANFDDSPIVCATAAGLASGTVTDRSIASEVCKK